MKIFLFCQFNIFMKNIINQLHSFLEQFQAQILYNQNVKRTKLNKTSNPVNICLPDIQSQMFSFHSVTICSVCQQSLNKEYPQFASSFAEPNPDERKPADRLVDQRNLLEETRLVLYREKIKPSTPGPTRLERKFRKMLEKDRVASKQANR